MIHCDVKICVGCKMCEVACSSYHFGAVSSALSRIRVSKLEEIGIDMAITCLSCLEKPCMVCPTDAMTIGEKGEILIEEEDCITCDLCMNGCPIGVVGFYDDLPLICDLCDGETSCVEACPSGALTYREDHKEISLAQFLKNEGHENLRRAIYVEAQAKPVRENWIAGGRVDS